MFVILTLTYISIGQLFGYVPETTTLMVFGICMIGLAVGIRRILKHQENKKTEEETKENR